MVAPCLFGVESLVADELDLWVLKCYRRKRQSVFEGDESILAMCKYKLPVCRTNFNRS